MELPSSLPSPNEGLRERRPVIVAIEDNPPDVFLIEQALSEHGIQADVKNLRDGEHAVAFIKGLDMDEAVPCSVLFLVDLNIPTKSGESADRDPQQQPMCSHAGRDHHFIHFSP